MTEATASLIAEARLELPGRRGRGRGAPRIRRRPAVLAAPRLHGPGRGRAAPDLKDAGLPAGRPDRQGRASRRRTRPSCAAPTAPRGRARRAGPQDSRSSQTVTQAAAGRSLTLTIDTQAQQDAEKALSWAMKAIGPEARRRDRDEPADRRDPGDGQPADLRQQPVRPRHQRDGLREAPQEPGQAAAQPRRHEQYPPGSTYKLVTGTGGLADKKITAATRVQTKGLPDARRGRSSTSGTTAAGAPRHLRRLRPLERHVLLPGRRHARHRSARLLGQAVRLRRADRHRSARRGRRASSRRTPGSRTRSASRSSPARPTRPGIGQGYDAVTPLQLLNAYAAAGQRRQALPAPDRPRGRRPGRHGRPAVRAEAHPQAQGQGQASCETMRVAARNVVTLRHTYNLVDLPIKVAGKSGTAEFGTRDSQGPPAVPLAGSSGFVPKDPSTATFDRRDSEARRPRLRLRLADRSATPRPRS